MNRNRIFRLLVCLILVCCLIIQVSPIRAKAVAIVDDLAIGYAALLILAACGVIFCPTTVQEVTAIGNSMTKDLREWGDATGATATVEAWIAGITLYDNYGGDDDNTPRDYKVELARGILAGIASWVCSVVLATTDVEVEEEAEVGFAYYNGVLLPSLDSIADKLTNYPNCTILYYPYESLYYLVLSKYQYVTDGYYLQVLSNSTKGGYIYSFDLDSKSWTFKNSVSGSFFTNYILSTDIKVTHVELIWVNYDLMNISSSTVYMPATEPVDYLTTILYPETYVGDIPQKIQDGEEDEETLVIPDIYYGNLLQDGQTLEQSLQNTMTQLKDGTLTYDEFMEQIKVQEETDPDATEDPSEEPTTDSGSSGSTTDPGTYALDLSNYFPFCIPFDLYAFLACLDADPVTPVIAWEVPLPDGSTYPLELNLSPFDSVAKLLRRLQLLVFIIGLAFKTRDLIKG